MKKDIVKLLEGNPVYVTVNSPTLFGDRTNSIVPEVGWTVVTKPVAFEKDNVAYMLGPPAETTVAWEDVPLCF